MLRHTSAKFFGDRHRGSGDIMALVCHAILQDHVNKGSSNVMGRTSSRLLTILPSLVAMSTVVVEMVLVCHVVLEDHVIKGSYGVIGRSPSR